MFCDRNHCKKIQTLHYYVTILCVIVTHRLFQVRPGKVNVFGVKY